ncbi:MAG: tRNA (N6-threonylcarbamoyladenosine(37)-N6)-methyltransferase TrmO [Anaerolineaceae bacterium 4572_5.2]|nr:MAG: tRNA (N6-threonylcarbamoyladenosine(37)-N6)-methyltransferase TrmO [Anaerolineaceae bacterium 4572_5.2]
MPDQKSESTLWLDPTMGISGDMFAAALLDLGAPRREMLAAMKTAGDLFGVADIHTHLQFLADDTPAQQLHIHWLAGTETLFFDRAQSYLDQALTQTGVKGEYARFAQRALAALIEAETKTHAGGQVEPQPIEQVSLSIIGVARTPYPYGGNAPYQPLKEDETEGDFYIELHPQYAAGLADLPTFTHLFIISYLDRSTGYSLGVTPPWGERPKQRGLFATRSPNRPSPIGLTRARIRRLEGNRVITGPLDLFDGTPVLDLKPFIPSLDGGIESASDGWLSDSDHLELHRRGIPHQHTEEDGHLREVRDILVLLTGAAWGLQALEIDLTRIKCLSSVQVGGGTVLTSRGRLPVPAPATQAILERFDIPYAPGPVEVELLTPAGAAILAGLSPSFITRQETLLPAAKIGLGMGQRKLERPNVLRILNYRELKNQ